jgi:hypothetical protein
MYFKKSVDSDMCIIKFRACLDVVVKPVITFPTIVFKVSLKHRLSDRAHREVKASPHLEIRCKAILAAEKNLKRGVATAGRRKSGDGGSESGLAT